MPDRVSRCVLLLTLLMFMLALTLDVTPVADLDGISHQSTVVVSEPEKGGMLLAGTPHGPIVIDGDANFADTALLEGWPGDGSPENPYIIDGLDIDFGCELVGHCMSISNTRVSFTISNCNLTGGHSEYMDWFNAPGAGINLENVTGGELVNNTCNRNDIGIVLYDSNSNTVANNTCKSDWIGICLDSSNSNTVTDNTCNDNDRGIELSFSDSNTVVNNTCNSNIIGIFLYDSYLNTVVNNTCLGNTQHDILEEFEPEATEPEERYPEEFDPEESVAGEFDPAVLLLIVLVGITSLGAEWRMAYRASRWAAERQRIALERSSEDYIIIPTMYRIVSWFRKRRALKHVDDGESLEPDSSEQ